MTVVYEICSWSFSWRQLLWLKGKDIILPKDYSPGFSPRGNYTRVSEYELRENNDKLEDITLWLNDFVALPVCT